MNGIKTTQKQLAEFVHELAIQGLCNERAYNFEQWNELREGQDYTCVAYSMGMYGVIAQVYYMKSDKIFAYV